MQQRRLRLGDVLDDYCPRERRITNHAVVAMIDDTVKQTRCTTCDAEHEYKEARVPAARRRKAGTPAAQLVEGSTRAAADVDESQEDASPIVDDVREAAEIIQTEAETHGEPVAASGEQATEAEPLEDTNAEQDEWPVHRPLIRATLPRPEGHTPERKAPDFTFRPAGGRFDSRNGQRQRGGHRQARNPQGQPQSGQSRFGGQRGPGHSGGPQGQRQGNRSGQSGGAGRPGPGQGRGPRPGGGRKRGR